MVSLSGLWLSNGCCLYCFSKADSIVTSKLLVKLQTYGITGQLLAWISLFLTNRTQRVVIDYCLSSECDVISGVPQGTVLGPILFLIYINDVEHVCCGDTKLQLFADDVKLYSNVSIYDASRSLHQSLDNLVAWANEWQLAVNISKCAVVSLSSKP